jgi:hypothetical protein
MINPRTSIATNNVANATTFLTIKGISIMAQRKGRQWFSVRGTITAGDNLASHLDA